MKKNIKEVVKMAAFYATLGFIFQILFWNLIIASTPVAAQNLRDVKISVNVNNIKLEKALQIIESKTNFIFSYLKDEIPADELISIKCTDESLYDILCNMGKSVGLSFSRINDYITIKKNTDTGENIINIVETCTIKGFVTDAETNEALQGVTVALRGTTIGTFTDKRGYFELNNLKPGKYTVAASYVGYSVSTNEAIIASGKTVEINFKLGQSALNLDEVVVTGSLSERSIRESANPITIISPKELGNRDLTSLSSVLQNVPGIVISGTNDLLSQGGLMKDNTLENMNIRGAGAGIGDKIKVIVDGVEMADPSMLAFLDRTQIERMEIARGPMSSTLYGSGSSEGIIQIFTKKGIGRLSVNFQTMLTSQESKYQDANPFNSQYSIGLSGSKGDVNFNLALNYSSFPISRWAKNNGIDEKDWSFSALLSGKINDISADLRVMKGISNSGVGEINQYHRIAIEEGWKNPDARFINPPFEDIRYKGRQLITSLTLKQPVTDNFYHNLTVSYTEMNQLTNYFTNNNSTYGGGVTSYPSMNYDIIKTTAKYFFNWKQPFFEFLKVDITGGFDLIDGTMYSNTSNFTTPFEDDVRMIGDSRFPVPQGGTTTNNTKGIFFEGVWGFWNNLFITTGYRTESNNSYGSNSPWYPIPRIGATYVIELGSFTLKPRISWGKSTQPVSAMYKADKVTTAGSYTIVQVGNPDLKPQVQTGWEYGADIFLSSNYSINISYYNQRVKDKILQVDIPDPSVYRKFTFQNLAQILNEGIEITARAIVNPFTIDLTYTRLSSKYGEGFPAVSTSANPEFYEGGKVMSVPTYSMSLRVNYTIPELLPWSAKGGNITLEYIAVGDEFNQDYMAYYRGIVETGKASNVWKVFSPYHRINLRGDYSILNNVDIFADVQNLLNNQDMLYCGPLKGRTISFGFNIRY